MRIRIADWFKAIILIVLIVSIWYFAGAITRTLVIFSIASVIAFLLAPVVDLIVSKEIHRVIAIVTAYTGLLITFSLAVFFFAPFVFNQLISFLQVVPRYAGNIQDLANQVQAYIRNTQYYEYIRQIPYDTNVLINQASTFITNQVRNIVGFIPSLVSLLFDFILIVIISAYLLLYLPHLNKAINRFLPKEDTWLYQTFLKSTKAGLQRYILGQIALMVIVGTLSGIGMWLLGIPYALLLGVWAGLAEAIPYLGPVLGAIPAVMLAATIKPIYMLWVILIFIGIQQLESTFLSPLVLGETIGVNPVLIVFAIVAGAEIAGVIGALVAVPVLVIISIILRFIRAHFIYLKKDLGPDEIVTRIQNS